MSRLPSPTMAPRLRFAFLVLAVAAVLPIFAVAAPPPPDFEAYPKQALERRLAWTRDARTLASQTATPPTPPDELWSRAFSLPAFDANVTAFAEFRGELIAAGPFAQASGVPAQRIARWNGQRWAPLGDGLARGLWPLALAVFEDRLYVGGYKEDENSSSSIRRWDGTAWEDVTSNLTLGEVDCFALHQGELVAGGRFALGGTPSTGVVRFRDDAWESVGLTQNSIVTGITTIGTTLYAAGRFGSYSENPPVVLKFNGTAWDTVAHARDASGAPYIGDLATFGGDLILGGQFQEVEGVFAQGLARLHNGQWSPFGNTGFVSSIHPTPSGLLIGGYFGSISGNPTNSVARWNGQFWQTFAEGLFYGADAVIEYQGRVVAGGSFLYTGDYQRPLRAVASWDGMRWSALSGIVPHGAGVLPHPGMSGPVRVFEVFDGSLYAGGTFLFENDAWAWPAHGVARWNGSRWDAVGPGFNGGVHALAWYDNQLIAAGGFPPFNIVRWDGEAWQPLGTGTDAPVYALLVRGGDLYAAGSFSLAGGLLCSGIARWDGGRWWPVGPLQTPGGNPIFYALEEFQGDVIAAGNFDAIGDQEIHDVARWNGREWSPVGGGPGAPVYTLEVHDGVLWAGGDVADAPPVGGASLHMSDGSGWSTPLVQPEGPVHRLLSTPHNGLFATGGFQKFGLNVVNGIARVSESSDLGSGLGGPGGPVGYALAAYEGGLYVGGDFTLAGGKSSFHVARWDGLVLDAGRRATLEPARPNPFARSTSVRFRLPPNSSGSVAVLDLGGRIVRTLRSGSFGAGPVDITWDGRDDGGALQPAGIYFIRMHSTAGDQTARVAFVP